MKMKWLKGVKSGKKARVVWGVKKRYNSWSKSVVINVKITFKTLLFNQIYN